MYDDRVRHVVCLHLECVIHFRRNNGSVILNPQSTCIAHGRGHNHLIFRLSHLLKRHTNNNILPSHESVLFHCCTRVFPKEVGGCKKRTWFVKSQHAETLSDDRENVSALCCGKSQHSSLLLDDVCRPQLVLKAVCCCFSSSTRSQHPLCCSYSALGCIHIPARPLCMGLPIRMDGAVLETGPKIGSHIKLGRCSPNKYHALNRVIWIHGCWLTNWQNSGMDRSLNRPTSSMGDRISCMRPLTSQKCRQ